jgi:hypothetical protein
VPVDDRARRVLESCIDSILQLDLLATMVAARDRYWGAETVASEFGVELAVAASDLEALGRRNLLDVRISTSLKYRFAPGSEQLLSDIVHLLTVYRRYPVPIRAVIADKARTQPIRDFADAFDLRKRERRG